jgi:D-alanyl-D-alanine carboxypeptidase
MSGLLRRRGRLALAAGLFVACSPAARAPVATAPAPDAAVRSAAAVTAVLDSIMREAYPDGQPGAAAIVVRHGEVLLRGGYGIADLEQAVPMRADHVFRIGSITKQFTGVAILLLAEEGRLSLDDPLTRFFPDYPTGDRTVTVEQLLGHTSGISVERGVSARPPPRRQDLTPAELIEMFREEPFDFEPGERWLYNNSGYILLGAIIEQLSGMSYGDFVRTRIFEPLGMGASSYADAARVTPNRIPGYSRRGDDWVNAEYLSMSHPYAAGSLLSSVDDLARWNAAIDRGLLLGEGWWQRAFTPVRLNDGRSTRYAAGWLRGRLGTYETIEHGGGINGFITHALRVPDAGLFVAILTNADRPLSDPSAISLRLADVVLGGVLDEPAIAVDPARLQDYVGVYRISEDATRTITLEDGRLYSQRTGGTRMELRPTGEDVFLFAASGTRLRFERDAAGRVTAMVLDPRAGMQESAARVADQ